MDHCIRVFESVGTGVGKGGGKEIGRIDLGERAYPTNVCFGGEDGRSLFTTELSPGRVCVVEGLPAPGLALNAWPAPR